MHPSTAIIAGGLPLALAKGIALANLCFVNLWCHILDGNPRRYYALQRPATRSRLAAASVNVITLGVALGAFFHPEVRTSRAADVVGVVLALYVGWQLVLLYRTAHDHLRPLRRLVRAILAGTGRSTTGRCILGALVIVAAVWVVSSPGLRAVLWNSADFLALAAIPLVPLTLGRAVLFAIRGHPADSPVRPESHGRSGAPDVGRSVAVGMGRWEAGCEPATRGSEPLARVVWVVFDELDYGLAFDRRPPGLALPAFDRLVAQSVSCTRAFPPAHCTALSMPALLTGLAVADTSPLSQDDLLLTLRGSGGTVRWSEQPSVFSCARALGARSALVGWCHPYSRVIGSHLDRCVWYEDRESPFATRRTFWGAYFDNFRSQFETGRYSLFGQSLAVRKSAAQHDAIRSDALNLVSAIGYDLVLIHWPIPHAPYFFDSKRRASTAANRGPDGYIDNLELTDSVLDELMTAVDACRRARETTLVVSSDHWWRASASYDGSVDQRVPFCVRFPTRDGTPRPGVCYGGEFETVRTFALIPELLRGTIREPAALTAWFASSASAAPADELRGSPVHA